MSDPLALTELEADLLKEVFNVGIGYAAASLSVLMRQPISLSVPQLEFFDRPELTQYLGAEKQLCIVQQQVTGEFCFTSTLLFPEESSINLVRSFAPPGLEDSMLLEMLEEGMAEIGNILINACIGKIAEMADVKFDLSLPEYRIVSAVEDFVNDLSHDADDSNILLISVEMLMRESSYRGDMIFLFDRESLKGFRQHLKAIFSKLGATSLQL